MAVLEWVIVMAPAGICLSIIIIGGFIISELRKIRKAKV